MYREALNITPALTSLPPSMAKKFVWTLENALVLDRLMLHNCDQQTSCGLATYLLHLIPHLKDRLVCCTLKMYYPRDPRESLFGDAIRKEILGLIERGTFRLPLLGEAGDNPNVIPCRYVLTIRHALDGTRSIQGKIRSLWPSRQRRNITSCTKM